MKQIWLMTLPEIEDEIEAIYLKWHAEYPKVKPKEHGRLAELWLAFDMLVAQS